VLVVFFVSGVASVATTRTVGTVRIEFVRHELIESFASCDFAVKKSIPSIACV
jgi:hypothetical protein